MLDVNYKKKYVGTYKEIAIMFLSFSIVLFVLYPRDMLKKQILSETSNYDLSILYLKNMLKNDSSNEDLMLALAQQSFEQGNKDLAFNLLTLLHDSANKARRAKAYLLSYQLAKSDYIYLKKKNFTKKAEKKYQELVRLFAIILHDGLYTLKDIENLYKEASFLGDKKASYLLVQKLLHKEPSNRHLLRDGYYLARNLGKNKEALTYIDKLLALGVENPQKWRRIKYNLLYEGYSRDDALAVLEKEAKSSKYWQQKLAEYHLSQKQYQASVNIYMENFHKQKDYKAKKKSFKKAIATLLSANKMQDAANLTYKYENFFFQDEQMQVEMLKTYMAAGDVKKARKLSQRMLQGGKE